MLIAVVFCFIVALLAMNPTALKAGDVPAKAEHIIALSWPDKNPNDIGLWVQDPGGKLVWLRGREAGLMHLIRDDRGLANDSIVVKGKQIVNPLNQGVVTLRGLAVGESTVNAHCYDSKDGKPVDCTVSIVKVNPRDEVVYCGSLTWARKGDEGMAARFALLLDGSATNINTLPRQLLEKIQIPCH